MKGKDFLNLKNAPYIKQAMPEKEFFLQLLDRTVQSETEKNRLAQIVGVLINDKKTELLKQTEGYLNKIEELKNSKDFSADEYLESSKLSRLAESNKKQIAHYDKLSNQPYFARMDLYDNHGLYTSLYIGKKGERTLGILDWRAPVAKRYYQKTSLQFDVNEFSYKVILRRSFDISGGYLIDWQNEYLNLRNFLSAKELEGSDLSVVFDPFLKEILQKRKKSTELTDIIETIQEQQYAIITRDKSENIIVQGCAGSGKTMVMLHRLSHIMYNDHTIKPAHVLVLTPSVSFNRFIDSLCRVLEIEKVKTETVSSYYSKLLLARGINFIAKVSTVKEPREYLDFIYSSSFVKYAETEIAGITGAVKDFFCCPEFYVIKNSITLAYERQSAQFKKLKNASKHIIKAVLGEIKLSKEKGVYFTREFRRIMSEAAVVNDFLCENLSSGKFCNHYYFFKRFGEFFESFKYIAKNLERILQVTLEDITLAKTEIENSIKSYKKHGEIPAIIQKVETLNHRIDDYNNAERSVRSIFEAFGGIYDLYEAIKSNTLFLHFGNAENDEGLAKFLYNEIIKPKKAKFNMGVKLYKSDLYAVACLLNLFGVDLRLGQSYIFIDEGQDLSASEYRLLRSVNDSCVFNIFGDTAQNISSDCGIDNWAQTGIAAQPYLLPQNYRNTNQIVKFVKDTLDITMRPIGLDGEQVKFISTDDALDFFEGREGISAVIGTGEDLKRYYKLFGKKANAAHKTGRISKTKINLLTVAESKGLEFSNVLVCDKNLSKNQKYIAYTRALSTLAVEK